MDKCVAYHIVHVNTHDSIQHRACNNGHCDSWEKWEMQCIPIGKELETVCNCSKNPKCCRTPSHRFSVHMFDMFISVDMVFVGSNLRKPVSLLNCSNCSLLSSASFPAHKHSAGTLVFLGDYKTLSCLLGHEHKH